MGSRPYIQRLVHPTAQLLSLSTHSAGQRRKVDEERANVEKNPILSLSLTLIRLEFAGWVDMKSILLKPDPLPFSDSDMRSHILVDSRGS